MGTYTLQPPAAPPDHGADASPTPPTDTSDSTPEGPRPTGWASRPLFTRGTLVALLAATAVLYLWGLSASGYANSFYSAAAQAGSQSWKAFFFGSLDASNAITVDKPPASLWLMALSVRIFGLSSWSILVPQALLGVATVGVLYASVRRNAGHLAGLLAGAVLALTPVAALMFRYNNPDALLVFLLTLAGYLTLRAAEKASGKWLVGAGILVGFAFLTKMLQAFLVLPAFVLVYLIAAPTSFKKRVLHLLGAFGAMIAALGWWVAIVELVPASWRPYIGGSTDNSILNLVFGYNGIGRLLGRTSGAATGAAGGASAGIPSGGFGGGGGFGAQAGITRLFSGLSGGMVGWLIPAALLLAGFALISLGRRPRTDSTRAAILLWTGWLVVTGLVFSFMAGTYHDYYTVALAPAIAALVAVAGRVLWRDRSRWSARVGLAVAMASTTAWGYILLSKASDPYNSMKWVVVAAGALATLGFIVANLVPRALTSLVIVLAVVAGLTGPAAYSINTVMTAHHGGIVTAGPVTQGAGGFPGGGGAPAGAPGGPATQSGTGTTRDGGRFGMDENQTVGTAISALLKADSQSYPWVAATTGSQSSATYQLATGLPVMAIGGFTGSDPSPTLSQFQGLVTGGKIHYYIQGRQGGGGFGGADRGGTSASIATWVGAHYTAKTVDGVTVYDLTQAK